MLSKNLPKILLNPPLQKEEIKSVTYVLVRRLKGSRNRLIDTSFMYWGHRFLLLGLAIKSSSGSDLINNRKNRETAALFMLFLKYEARKLRLSNNRLLKFRFGVQSGQE